ncbi:MAG: hypothetical protein LBG70_04855, partial [Bifidobacteriaceae bacterium]|nr:hypothetical protein [Bifidobacteriaceae bacterium]
MTSRSAGFNGNNQSTKPAPGADRPTGSAVSRPSPARPPQSRGRRRPAKSPRHRARFQPVSIPVTILTVLGLAGLGVVVTSPAAVASTPGWEPTADFNCNTLYSSLSNPAYGMQGIPSPVEGQSWSMTLKSTGGSYSPGWGGGSNFQQQYQLSTLAVGPDVMREDNRLQAYTGEWEPNSSNGYDVNVLPHGQTTGWTFKAPKSRFGTSGNMGWEGSAINPKDGLLYMEGARTNYISDSGRRDSDGINILIMDPNRPVGSSGEEPQDGNYRRSSSLMPLTEADKIGSTGMQLVEDLFTDADGNVYLVSGFSDNNMYLLKVTPGEHNQPWYWTKLFKISSSTRDYWYGMAFLNGKIWVNRGGTGNGSRMGTINPLTGAMAISTVANGTAANDDHGRDLASCQLPPVITGTVFDDANGNGQIEGDESGVAGQTVEIYDSNGVLLGSQQTDGGGSYTFMVNENSLGENGDYYIRLVRPQVAGVNAAPTWSSADQNAPNPVTAYCHTAAGDYQPSLTSGICQGARADQVDQLAYTVGAANIPAPLDADAGALIVSKVHMTTEFEVAHADFAVTGAASQGDAPYQTLVNASGPGTSQGPSHIQGELLADQLYLGVNHGIAPAAPANPANIQDLPTANNHADTDDGVFLGVGPESLDAWTPLQNQVLIYSNTFRVKAKVGGYALAQRLNELAVGMWGGNMNGTGTNTTAPTSFTVTSPFTCGSVSAAGEAICSFTAPAGKPTFSSANYVQYTWIRTRVGLSSDISFVDTPPYPPARTTNTTNAWWMPGEVEDNRVFLGGTNNINLVVKSIGGTASFPHEFSSDIHPTFPSTRSIAITTPEPNKYFNDGSNHLLAGTTAKAITVTTDPPTGWTLSKATLYPSGAASQTLTATDGKVTIPAGAMAPGGNPTLALDYVRLIDPDQFDLTITDFDNVKADGLSAQTATVSLRAADGGGLSGLTATLEPVSFPEGVDARALTMSADGQCITDEDGQCQITITSTAAGQFGFKVSAEDSDESTVRPTDDTERTTHWGADANTCQVRNLTVNPTGRLPVSDVTNGFTATVQVRDANGNNCPGQEANIVSSISPATGTRTSEITAVGPNSGDYNFTIGSTSSGVKTVTASLGGGSANTTVEFRPLTADKLTTTLTIDADNAQVGQTITGHVVIRDQFNNLVPNVPVHVWTGPSDLIPPELNNQISNSSGEVHGPIATTVAGEYQIFAEVTTEQGIEEVTGSGQTITFTPEASSARATLTRSPASGSLVPTPTNPFHLTVTITDQYNNLISGAPAELYLASSIPDLLEDGQSYPTDGEGCTVYKVSGLTGSNGQYVYNISSNMKEGLVDVSAM